MTITEFLQNGAGVPGGHSEAEPGAASAQGRRYRADLAGRDDQASLGR
jgi:hypothetical protein